jgi:hypothetical protein
MQALHEAFGRRALAIACRAFGVVVAAVSIPAPVVAGPTLPPSFVELGRINVIAGASAFDLVVSKFATLERLLFGNSVVTGTVAAFVDPDPYFAVELDITNLSSTPQAITLHAFSPMVPVLAPVPPSPFPAFQARFDYELFDANGDGAASYGGGGVHFFIADSVSGAGFQITPRFGIETDEAGAGGITPFGPVPVPPPFSGQWNAIEMFHTGFNMLSAGDRIVIKGFGCVALLADVCPSPTEVSQLLAVPEPAAGWLWLAGLGALFGLAKLRRGG